MSRYPLPKISDAALRFDRMLKESKDRVIYSERGQFGWMITVEPELIPLGEIETIGETCVFERYFGEDKDEGKRLAVLLPIDMALTAFKKEGWKI